MRSYEPEKLFDDIRRLAPALAALAPKGERHMGANPHANAARNVACQPDVDIARDDSVARILVIKAQEELCIARQARQPPDLAVVP